MFKIHSFGLNLPTPLCNFHKCVITSMYYLVCKVVQWRAEAYVAPGFGPMMLTSIFNFAKRPTVIISLVILIFGRYSFVHERIYPNTLTNLNVTVGGRLRTAAPLALPCFSSCDAVQANYDSNSFRSRAYGSTVFVGYCSFSL